MISGFSRQPISLFQRSGRRASIGANRLKPLWVILPKPFVALPNMMTAILNLMRDAAGLYYWLYRYQRENNDQSQSRWPQTYSDDPGRCLVISRSTRRELTEGKAYRFSFISKTFLATAGVVFEVTSVMVSILLIFFQPALGRIYKVKVRSFLSGLLAFIGATLRSLDSSSFIVFSLLVFGSSLYVFESQSILHAFIIFNPLTTESSKLHAQPSWLDKGRQQAIGLTNRRSLYPHCFPQACVQPCPICVTGHQRSKNSVFVMTVRYHRHCRSSLAPVYQCTNLSRDFILYNLSFGGIR